MSRHPKFDRYRERQEKQQKFLDLLGSIARLSNKYPEDTNEAAKVFVEVWNREFRGKRRKGVFWVFAGLCLSHCLTILEDGPENLQETDDREAECFSIEPRR